MNLLLNRTDFDQRWAASELIDIIHEGLKVVIFPFMHNEGYTTDLENYNHRFSKDSDYIYDLKRPFIAYGVEEENIDIAHIYQDGYDTIKKKVEGADIIFLAGDDPDDIMDQIEDQDLVNIFKSFQKLFIGASAGSLVQMESFPSEYSEDGFREGLGVVGGIDLELHYEENEYHLANIIHCLETRRDQILVLPEKSGILIDGLNCEFLGSAFLFDMTHLDQLYDAYKTYLL